MYSDLHAALINKAQFTPLERSKRFWIPNDSGDRRGVDAGLR